MKVDYTLYLCTDSGLMSCNTVEESVERAIQGGVSVVQLREKEASSRELFELAKRVKRVTDKYDVPLIINDRLDICLAVDAAGVHLGQTDLPCSEARRILGAEKIIGVSAATPEEAAKAESDGAAVPERAEASARVSEALRDKNARVVEIPYKNIYRAYECSHSFYLFPVMENKDEQLDAIICDKTQFICGTPMQARDRLARGCGKRFKIKVKKA